MKEINLVSNTVWQCIAIVASTIILAAASVFIVLQHNRTQWDIASLEKEALVKSAEIEAEGQEEAGRRIGRGMCAAGREFTLVC